jgi:3'-phosphoadenosine 5'-phosphosulfate sulfotransferase (PAPS reductase)/FAD synthetase
MTKIIVNISSGKDSTLCLKLAIDKVGKENVIAVFQDTSWEADEVYEYLQYLESFFKIKILRIFSEKYDNILHLIYKKGIFPSPSRRFCTQELKLKPIFYFLLKNDYYPSLFNDYEVWVGIRRDESNEREEKYKDIDKNKIYTYSGMFTHSSILPARLRDMKVRYPIVDLTTKEVFTKLKKANIDPNKLYEMGFDRVGCAPCILGGKGEFKRWYSHPQGRENIEKLFKLEETMNMVRGCVNEIKITPQFDRFALRAYCEGKEISDEESMDETCMLCRV